jgi:hypothetical protein
MWWWNKFEKKTKWLKKQKNDGKVKSGREKEKEKRREV